MSFFHHFLIHSPIMQKVRTFLLFYIVVCFGLDNYACFLFICLCFTCYHPVTSSAYVFGLLVLHKHNQFTNSYNFSTAKSGQQLILMRCLVCLNFETTQIITHFGNKPIIHKRNTVLLIWGAWLPKIWLSRQSVYLWLSWLMSNYSQL